MKQFAATNKDKNAVCLHTKTSYCNNKRTRNTVAKITFLFLTQNKFHCHVRRKDSDLSFFVYTFSQIEFA